MNKIIALTSAVMLATLSAMAEESGTGHYDPGQTADFADALPGFPSFEYVNIFTYYNGSASGSRGFPIIGRVSLNLESTSYTESSSLLWATPLKVFGGYYTVFASIPYTWLTISGDLQTPGGLFTRRTRPAALGTFTSHRYQSGGRRETSFGTGGSAFMRLPATSTKRALPTPV